MNQQLEKQQQVKNNKIGQNNFIYTPYKNWDAVSIQEINKLWDKIDNFYKERNYPRMNAVWLADLFLKRLKNDQDCWINCEGIKGKGKSNLILLLSLLMCRNSGIYQNKKTNKYVKVLPRITPLDENEWEHIEFGFKFNRNMSFLDNSQDVKNKFNALDQYSPFLLDEGSKNLHKYGWQSKTQFMLVQLSDTERYQNKCVFVCLPNFKELNPTFRNDRIMMRLYVYHRSQKLKYSGAIISIKDPNRHIIDPWHMDENAKTYEKFMKKISYSARTNEIILKAEKKLKGYVGHLEIPSLKHLSPKIWNIYMKYKIANAQKELSETTDEKEIEFEKKMHRWKFATHNLIEFLKERVPHLTYKDISHVCSLSSSQISTLRNEMNPKQL